MQIRKMRLAERNEHSQIEVKGFVANFYATRIWALTVILCLICLCSTASAADYYAGQTYTFSTHSYPGYLYLWNAEDEQGHAVGTYTDNTNPDFVWTAPSLAQKVKISVIISANVLESCNEYSELIIDVLPLSGITVVKDAVPDDQQAFDFSLTGQDGFPLIDNGDPATAQKSFSDLIPGTYTITESGLIDWDITEISVTGTASTPVIDESAGTISFDLAASETVIVTFTNTKRGSIVVVKDALPNDLQDFAFTAAGPESYISSFTLDDDSGVTGEDVINSNKATLINMKPGTYTITESGLVDWDITEISVTGTASTPIIDKLAGTISFDLAASEAVTVTFTNTKRGSITVMKDAIPLEGDYSTQPFTFSSDKLGSFTLVDNGEVGQPNSITFNNLVPGDYQIVEQYQSGWYLNYIDYTGADSSDLRPDVNGTIIHLKEGESATVTFGNTQDNPLPGVGSITVIKDVMSDPGFSTQEFAFLSSLDPTGSFKLVDDGPGGASDSITFNNLPVPGDYQIVEQYQKGWILNSINCIGAGSDDLRPDVNGTIIHLIEGAPSATVTFGNSKDNPLPGFGKLTITKTALNASVHRGEDIIYDIMVCNVGDVPLTNVIVWDILPKGVELVSVYPEPSSSSSLSWFVGTLGPKDGPDDDSCFPARITVRVPVVDINYDMSQDVQGEGFVNVHNDYDTHQGPESVTNCAYARANITETITETVSSCVTTGIVDPGTELSRREFGSGTYESEELTRIRTENKSIKTVTSLSAIHKPTTFSLPQGRSIGYATKWTEKSKGRNTVTGASMTEEYTSATSINKERSIELDKNGSTMKTEVEFSGQGHIGVLKKQAPDSHPKVKTVFESQEDYAGNFKIYEMVDEYDTSVVSNKSTTGFGYVAVDKRIKDRQRTYESGTGSYQSEELIDTPTSYMAKNISLVHAPAGYSYSPSFIADQDMKWSEGMWSKSGGLSGGNLITDIGPSRLLKASSCLANSTSPGTLISEKYSYLDNLQKETAISGLNEMKTDASFSGTADYRVLSHGENGTSVVDNEERYVGTYDINRHVLLTGTSKYDIPHLTVIKEGRIKNEWYNKVNATQAEYTITITNDGTRALAPIYVRDMFPAGTQYVKSTIRPASLAANEANWTLVNLGIGNTITIGLTLNVTEGSPGNNLVNRVVACGVTGDKSVCAGNYSSLEFGWQTCCPPEVLVSKKAWLDESDPTEVHYRIVVKNNAKDSVAVTVTDQLPGGMTLLGASINPNTDSIGQMVWALPKIKPGRFETIDYTAKALRDGGYTSTVHIDATAIDGTGYDTMDASAYIEITRTGIAAKTFRYDGWEPPAWNLSAPEPGLNMDPVLELEVDSGN